ncbi:hypothetical protein SK803_37110 [Lentzea sp. BCCO 10_0856]|uniref:Excreted virulence factor EspC, type VII ESX diderm n=1 Tax=Lentzea miocenica TaxID=3095431 RepID=A0ABU4TCD1_9PSEU|nr:hypothetical protein [Lentzea sp. BCCO 10_0856]MDX8035850.1 hypothetical protein [Lentzea sp. BCCO 10_0856]
MPEAFFSGMRGISESVAAFSASVAAGVGVNEQGGQALIKAVDKMHKGISDALQKTEFLSQEPPLGTTPAAQVYKPFLATIATDPAQGFITAAKQFQKELEQMRADVEKAMAAYQTADQDAKQGINKAGG